MTSLSRTQQLASLTPGSRVHVAGICGTGTSAVAVLLAKLGYRVSGSDIAFYPPMGEVVKEIAKPLFSSYSAANIIGKELEQRPDFVIIGNSLSEENSEVQAVLNAGIPYCSMPEAFSALLIGDRSHCLNSIVVSGTHGKTTTTSIVAAMLNAIDWSPGYFIGGLPKNFSSGIREVNTSLPLEKRTVVLEGDEYDSAFFLKQPKFLSYRPDIVVITGVEFDHADIYQSLEEIEAEFAKLVSLVPESGIILAADSDERLCQRLLKLKSAGKIACPVMFYGTSGSSQIQIKNRKVLLSGQKIEICSSSGSLETASVKLSGLHNAYNYLAAVGVALHLGISLTDACRGIESFAGVSRRQDILFESEKQIVIEDFAHHPTEVKETLSAIKEAYPQRRVIAVFEPRSNTSRRDFFQQRYIDSFAKADWVILKQIENTKIYSKFGAEAVILDVEKLASEVLNTGVACESFLTVGEIEKRLFEEFKDGDVLLLMSNGDFGGLAGKIVNRLLSSS